MVFVVESGESGEWMEGGSNEERGTMAGGSELTQRREVQQVDRRTAIGGPLTAPHALTVT